MAPIGKHRPDRRIDRQPARALGVAGGDGSGFTAPPTVPSVSAPGAPSLSAALTFSAVTPSARIDATWADASAYDGEVYAVAISTDSTFATGTEIYTTAPNQTTASIDNRAVNTTYFVRLRTLIGLSGSDWGPSASITTPVDTTPPGPVTSIGWAWGASGDLEITWTDPASLNLKSVVVNIWNSAAKSIVYRALIAAAGVQRTVYTAAMNAADTANVYDAAIYIEVSALSWGGVYSTVAVPGVQPSKAAPAAPTGLTCSWTGDTGTAGGDLAISWTRSLDAVAYRLTIDGGARELLTTAYTYAFDANRTEHSGTADPVLSLSLIALDGLHQASTAATLTATNAAPAAPTINLLSGQNQLVCIVTSAKAGDFLAYEYLWKRDGTALLAQESASSEQQYATGAGDEGTHSWTCTVRQKDMFAQFSSSTVSSAVVLDTLTIGYLRAGLIYTDSVGNSVAALAVLKDDNKVSGGISYAA